MNWILFYCIVLFIIYSSIIGFIIYYFFKHRTILQITFQPIINYFKYLITHDISDARINNAEISDDTIIDNSKSNRDNIYELEIISDIYKYLKKINQEINHESNHNNKIDNFFNIKQLKTFLVILEYSIKNYQHINDSDLNIYTQLKDIYKTYNNLTGKDRLDELDGLDGQENDLQSILEDSFNLYQIVKNINYEKIQSTFFFAYFNDLYYFIIELYIFIKFYNKKY